MHKHPQWEGIVKRVKIVLAEEAVGGEFNIDSFFTVFDTRHTINNPIYIMACWEYYRWTGEVDFLRQVIGKMRRALRYQQTVMGGLAHKHIRNEWVGHTGITGFTVDDEGEKTVAHGQGIGSNYWDLLPFGWDDLYATSQYHKSLLVMADLEEAIAGHAGWDMPADQPPLNPDALRAHAAEVKDVSNAKFWNPETGRFVACIDKNGDAHDYGLTFLNLDAIWYGLVTDEHQGAIMDWLTGKRIVEGDTSTGAEIYHWRFGPRATTKRNVAWYGFFWSSPESIPWGGQVQDGGAVLGFSFYDLWARLHTLGADNAWQRLSAIMAWDKEVWAEGGYRAYYKDGQRGTTLQGGGTAGGLGIDFEFFESSLLTAILVHGFLGINPDGDTLRIQPQIPEGCPKMGIQNLLFRGVRMDIAVQKDKVQVREKDAPGKAFDVEVAASNYGDTKLNFTTTRHTGRYPAGIKNNVPIITRQTISKEGLYLFEQSSK